MTEQPPLGQLPSLNGEIRWEGEKHVCTLSLPPPPSLPPSPPHKHPPTHTLPYPVIECPTAIIVELYSHQVTPHFLHHSPHTSPTHPISCIHLQQRGRTRRLKEEKSSLPPPLSMGMYLWQ